MGARKPDGSSAKTERVTFTRPAAERIAKVVRKVEQGDRGSNGLRFLSRSGGGGASPKTFRICTYTGEWSINSSKTVTFKNQTATPNTVSATNLFFNIGTVTNSEARDCAIAKDGTAWYLVQVKQGDVEELDVVYNVKIDGTGLKFERKRVVLTVAGTADDVVIPLINCAT